MATGAGAVGATVPRVTLTDENLAALESVFTTPNPASTKAGRTYMTKQLTAQTADAQLHTNTALKVFYVTSIIFGMVNTSTSAQGQVIIRDGTSAAGTAIIPLLSPTAGAGVLSSAVGNITTPVSFAEPVKFSTGIFCDIAAGAITYSVMAIGYEE